ncbi:protein HEXIM1-like [Carcharodon carcharias]|uniref:protein HEXIM1-like n=1 Tax=Carcharodon carcharias TaxID=13397 RepID=UPI001B7EB90D|nr:protein HEXIM1-like [Carcharodon carcharias]
MSRPVMSAGPEHFLGRIGERSQGEGGLLPPSPSAPPQPREEVEEDEETKQRGRDGRGRTALSQLSESVSDAEAEQPGAPAPGGGVGAGGGGGGGGGGAGVGAAGGGGGGGGGGKRRHRRRPSKKKRRWKPYFKLSWEEKKKLDERESVRAAKTRAEMFAKGFTVAPYNTTQFLMEEHNQEEPDLNTGVCPKRAGRSDETSEEEELDEEEQDSGSDGMGGDGGGEFLQKDFSETYEKYHAESLQNMTKQELIREYLELEKCLSRLEDENNRLRCRLEGKVVIARGGEVVENKLKELEREIERLKAENHQLLKENELYKRGKIVSDSAD